MGFPAKVNKVRAVKLREAGLTLQEIGDTMGVSKVAVHTAIKGMILPQEALETFKSSRADILSSKQAEALMTLTTDKLKDCSAYQLAGITGLLYDKERLERDKSTSNVSVLDVTGRRDRITSDRLKLIAQLGFDPEDIEGPDDVQE